MMMMIVVMARKEMMILDALLREERDLGIDVIEDPLYLYMLRYIHTCTHIHTEGKGEDVTAAAVASEDEFEPTIAGPWMLRWDLVHHNDHTSLLEKQQQSQQGKEAWRAGWHKA